ncbi:MAG: excinuclease ABC subunit UvrA [Lentisphaeria bacterium]|nr:excinuclease ABC subunit UvrA [Lentisphaeria bacterium]
MSLEDIVIHGASQHNLKNIDVRIPRNSLTVVTGLSGSGKSSLAFDTLYAEGQRRYVESLSAYARQFLDRMQKPQVRQIEGLSPAIAIEQRSSGANPRSTVGTVTEIYDYLRLLYAHTGVPHCPECGRVLEAQSPQGICEKILKLEEGLQMMILSPYVNGKKGELRDVLEKIRKDGFIRARIDGRIQLLDGEELPVLEKNLRHTIEAVVDRLITGKVSPSRLNDSVETALKTGNGNMVLLLEDKQQPSDGTGRNPSAKKWIEERISEHFACPDCQISFPKPEARNFSFNSPFGACPRCNGLGSLMVMDPALVIPDETKSIRNGAIPGWRKGFRRLIIYYNHLLRCVAEHYGLGETMLTTPWKDLPEKIRHVLLYGSGEEKIDFSFRVGRKTYKSVGPFEGILANLQRRQAESESESVRDRLKEYMTYRVCPDCQGMRLKKESLAVTVGGLSIHEFNSLSVEKALDFMEKLQLDEEKTHIAGEILKEIRSRLIFLKDVGLSYLTLARESSTLSGGEAQRIRLATQLGCGLVGVLYILDEPSIGLHQKDNDKLLATLKKLRSAGNTVVVVEHDMDTICAADHVLDLGPQAGVKGGYLVAAGTPQEIRENPASITGKYLNGVLSIPVPAKRLAGNGKYLEILGAQHHNLKDVDVKIPLGTFCCVTGVSGSGKSSLVNGILHAALTQHFHMAEPSVPGKHRQLLGLENLDKAIVIDQSPIGRTPRSNPATYTELFGTVRTIFSKLPESRMRGFGPGRFSFNVKGGRCEECQGDGIKKIEMQFLPDVYVTCSACQGKRFNKETLSVTYKHKNIAQILEMTVDEAVEFFEAVPTVYRKLKTLQEVGLGYIQLGQSGTTLSGGEAQRVKLATELARMSRGHTLYILDEPTTGLHIDDIRQLLEVLIHLRDKGNTVLVIEHNLDVIKMADHIIDLGPEGGENGGRIVAQGTPEEVAAVPQSYTGIYLAKMPGIVPVEKASPSSVRKASSTRKKGK